MFHERLPGSDRARSLLTLIVAVVAVVVIGGCGTAAVSTTTTIRTPRGGAAEVGNPTALRNSVLSSIVCTSQDHCVAVGISVRGVAKVPTVEAVAKTMFGIAATTSDGGVHWASFSLTTRIETAPALSCPSANSCVAVGGSIAGNHAPSSVPPGATPNPVVLGKVLRTADGGETWASSVIPAGVGRLTGVSCPTKTFCVAVGETPDGNMGVALVTTNSGRVWTHLSLPRHEGRLALVSCPSVNNCVVVGAPLIGATVITTTNGGKSWAQTSLPQALSGTEISESISCPSSTRCFIVGGFTQGDGTPSGLVYTSSHSGNLWTSQSLPFGTTGLFGISCRTPTTCVVVGGGYGGVGGIILTTTDAGQTWTPRSEPAAVSGLQNVSCPTLDKCVATGGSPSATRPPVTQEVVATSSDGGITWTSVTP
jgi:photosystem II stability/assembly factor-like uncharacterized protein